MSDGKKKFTEGKEYVSEMGGCLTNDEGNKYHQVHGLGKNKWLEEHFEEVKTYSLTKEQLRSLTDPKIKEWFPEVFEPIFEKVLETGKWYKSFYGCLKFFKSKTQAYGFDALGLYEDLEGGFDLYSDFQKWEEATESEVFEALKNEAVKRGYKFGIWIKNSYGEELISKEEYFDTNYEFDEDGDFLYEGFILFEKGKWAEIIPTKTRSEAEKEFNCKIVD